MILTKGTVIDSHCSACHTSTPHRYEPADRVKLVCERCEAERKEKQEAKP